MCGEALLFPAGTIRTTSIALAIIGILINGFVLARETGKAKRM